MGLFDYLPLLGVLIVVLGFVFKVDTIATVVLAGVVTGLVSNMTLMDILNILGKSFISQRVATLFVLTLPVIGLCERYGLKEKAVDLIKRLKNATSGFLLTLYQVIRSIAGAASLRLGGHPQFVRPLINPMVQAAFVAKYGKEDKKAEEYIKGYSAASENFGNFFSQNCFMGASGTLLIVSTLSEQGFAVTALDIAKMSIPVCIIAVLVGAVHNYFLDYQLKKIGNKDNQEEKE
ncbi:membrane protein [Clostridia bacterium]|nr:membrane protein [Clostridia bacterium]